MSHLFISYASQDHAIADRLVDELLSAGFNVWIDRASIRGGDHWRQIIVQAIEECEAFILLLSDHSVQSRNVRKELDIADNADKRVFPLELEAIPLPDNLKYQLAGVQRISGYPDLETGIANLLASLGEGSSYSQNESDSWMTEPGPLPTSSELRSRHYCPICDLPFVTPSDLNTHLDNWHTEGVVCQTCGKLFKSQTALNQHTRDMHGSMYQCAVCGLPFKTQTDLDRHMTNWHT